MTSRIEIPPKLYFRIGEASSVIGVEPHVRREAGLQPRHHRVVLLAGGGGRVHHPAAQHGLLAAQRGHGGRDVLHANLVDKHVRRRVIAQHDHQHAKVLDAEFDGAIAEFGENAAAAGFVLFLYPTAVGQV